LNNIDSGGTFTAGDSPNDLLSDTPPDDQHRYKWLLIRTREFGNRGSYRAHKGDVTVNVTVDFSRFRYKLRICPAVDIDLPSQEEQTLYAPYVLQVPSIEADQDVSIAIDKDGKPYREVTEFPSSVLLEAGEYDLSYSATCTHNGTIYHENKDIGSLTVQENPMTVSLEGDKTPFYSVKETYSVSIAQNLPHYHYTGTITWPDGSTEDVDFTGESFTSEKDISFDSGDTQQFNLHICLAGFNYCIDKAMTVRPQTIVPSVSLTPDKNASFIGKPPVQEVTLSFDWPGTGNPPSCAYGEYDEENDECVYPANCPYGEYDAGSGKCKMNRYSFKGAGVHYWATKDRCDDYGAHPPTIMSEEENQAIKAIASSVNDSVWIDLRYDTDNGWRWATGEEVVYTNWDEGYPNGKETSGYYNETFAKLMKDDGKWHNCSWGNVAPDYVGTLCEWDWEPGATGLCPEGYEYQRGGFALRDGYCYGVPECPDGYQLDQYSGNCIQRFPVRHAIQSLDWNYTLEIKNGEETIYSATDKLTPFKEALKVSLTDEAREAIKSQAGQYYLQARVYPAGHDDWANEVSAPYTVKDVNVAITITGPQSIDVSQEDTAEFTINTVVSPADSPYTPGPITYSIPELDITDQTLPEGQSSLSIDLPESPAESYHITASVCLKEMPDKCGQAEEVLRVTAPEPQVAVNCPREVVAGRDVTCSAAVDASYGTPDVKWLVDGKDTGQTGTDFSHVFTSSGTHHVTAVANLREVPSVSGSADVSIKVGDPQISVSVSCRGADGWSDFWISKRMCPIGPDDGGVRVTVTHNAPKLTRVIKVKDADTKEVIATLNPEDDEISLTNADLNIDGILQKRNLSVEVSFEELPDRHDAKDIAVILVPEEPQWDRILGKRDGKTERDNKIHGCGGASRQRRSGD
ncbi:MAG: hypothetical protein JRJ31_22035, partial [Deltaproteobacteria bacterium]|nr:hypothetical protein [Deltaproteobacteria bacterium]